MHQPQWNPAEWLDPLWCLCVTIFRGRYSLLTLLLPPLLAVAALWRRPRGTLYSLLLPRGYRDGSVMLGRTLADIFWIAFTACSIATLAGAGLNVATIHGPERAGSYAPPAGCLSAGTAAVAPLPAAAVFAWPLPLLFAAVAAAAILPGVCIAIWRREQPDDQKRPAHVPLAVAAAVAGGLAAAAVVLLVGVVRRSLFGADDWILPVRPPFAFDCRGAGGRMLAAAGAGLGAVGIRDGYLDGRGHLLAGQAELMLSVFAASLVYAGSLVRTALTERPRVWVCTAVYLLVFIGTAGVVLAGVAFWADRYGLSTLVMVVLFTCIVGWLADTDHFFELLPRRGSAAAAPDLPAVRDCFDARVAGIPADAAGDRTAIVVSASGGGIQASAWTAEVLTRLARECPEFERSLCLASSVSGGSVGLGYFLAGTYLHPLPDAATHDDREARRHSIRNRARASLLEHVAWGAAFADLPRLFTGIIPTNRLVDRGWAIEWLLDRRMSFTSAAAREPLRSWSLRDLHAAVGAGAMPVPLVNATCVQTGQRVIATPVSFARRCAAGGTGPWPLLLPEDYSAPGFPADPRLATAIRLSAAFSYVSPVARPTRGDQRRWNAVAPGTDSAPRTRFDLHLCDGAYADNTGVVSAAEAGVHLLDAVAAANRKGAAEPDAVPRRCRVLWLRIEPFPRASGRPIQARDGFRQVLFGPAFGLLSARAATQQERADREIEQFAVAAASRGIDFAVATIRFRSPPTNASPDSDPDTPPLSWLLSQRQQRAIEESWSALSGAAGLDGGRHTPVWHLATAFGPATDGVLCRTGIAAAAGDSPAG